MSQYEYTARLAPIDKTIEVLTLDGPIYERFTRWSFLGQVDAPEQVTFNVRHSEKISGRLNWLGLAGGWWCGRFRLDHTLRGAYAQDALEVGTPVSIGFRRLLSPELGHSDIVQHQMARLDEVSLVDEGAIEGAEVILKLEIPRPSPRARGCTG